MDINKELPEDTLGIVMEKFMKNDFDDYMSLRATCNSFREFAKEKGSRCYQKPWIKLGNKPGEKTCTFFSPLEGEGGKFYNLKLPKFVRRSHCCGSCEGWLIMAHKTRGNFIFNPITRTRITLPLHRVEHDYNYLSHGRIRSHTHHIKRCPHFLKKVVLSTAAASSLPPLKSISPKYVAACIAGNDQILVGFCPPILNNNKWRLFSPYTLEESRGLLHPDRDYDKYEEESFEDLDEEEILEEEVEEEYEDVTEEEILEEVGEDYRDLEEEKEEDEEKEANDEKGEEEVVIRVLCCYLTDILFYKGEFYVVSQSGGLIVFKVINHDEFSFRWIYTQPLKLKRKEFKPRNASYLVESFHGELLMVVRVRRAYVHGKQSYPLPYKWGEYIYKTKMFVVFILDESGSEPFRWVRVDDIGDQVLFLGRNYSKSVSSHDIQTSSSREYKGVRNCIYFSDDMFGSMFREYDMNRPVPYKDSGVYHLGDGSIDNFELPQHHIYNLRAGQPIWFTPTL